MIEPLYRNGETEDYIHWAKETAGVEAVYVNVIQKSVNGLPTTLKVYVVVDRSYDEMATVKRVAENIRSNKPSGPLVEVILLRPYYNELIEKQDGNIIALGPRYSEDPMTNTFLRKSAIASEILSIKCESWTDEEFIAALKMIIDSHAAKLSAMEFLEIKGPLNNDATEDLLTMLKDERVKKQMRLTVSEALASVSE